MKYGWAWIQGWFAKTMAIIICMGVFVAILMLVSVAAYNTTEKEQPREVEIQSMPHPDPNAYFKEIYYTTYKGQLYQLVPIHLEDYPMGE